jgi:hypothetical protein
MEEDYVFPEPITQGLIDALEKKFPDKMPDTANSSEKKLAFLHGQVFVVRFLKRMYEEQNEILLK